MIEKGEQKFRKNHTEQIIDKLREAKTHINQGISIAGASRVTDVTEQTYYRCCEEYLFIDDEITILSII